MAQVTTYLDKHIEAKMNAAAKAMRLSKSKWIANLIEEKLNQQWPASIIEAAGSWDDFPSAEQIRKSIGKDGSRGSF